MLTRMRWLLGGTAAAWTLYIGYLIMADHEGPATPLRSALVLALAVVTTVAAMAVAVGEAMRRVLRELAHAVEFGRRLERLRGHGAANVVPLTRRRPVGG